jgi:GT2 family glycosyltransferase
MDLSIVIISWNAKAYLEQCLSSVIAETRSLTTEIIVVDNASIDGSPEMVKAKFPQVKLICNSENLGFARANNLGIRQSCGEYICLVNSDVKVLPGCFYRLHDFMKSLPMVGMAGPRILNADGSLQASARQFPSLWRTCCRTFALDKLFPNNPSFSGEVLPLSLYQQSQSVDALSGCFWIMRRQAQARVGGLDEDFFMYKEDVDWCRRMHVAGWDLWYCQTAAAIHYGGGSSGNAPTRFLLERERANIQYWRKHHHWLSTEAYRLLSLVHQINRVAIGSLSWLADAANRETHREKLVRNWACARWLSGFPARPRPRPSQLNSAKDVTSTTPSIHPASGNSSSLPGLDTSPKYVLVTAARNEEKDLPRTIESVTRQTVLPVKWIIVSDGSTDRTAAIVKKAASTHPFIELVELPSGAPRDFSSKVFALRPGLARLDSLDYEYVGNLDADVSFTENYFEQILGHFGENPQLGIAGGFIYEEQNGEFRSRPSNSSRSVAGAVQLFRRRCFEGIGGYQPLHHGGIDALAELMARSKGWQVQAFPELPVRHHRPTGYGDGQVLRTRLRQGKMDYDLGSHPLFEVVKCLRRGKERPYAVGALLRLASFVNCHLLQKSRPISPQLVQVCQAEQKSRLKQLFSSPGKRTHATQNI